MKKMPRIQEAAKLLFFSISISLCFSYLVYLLGYVVFHFFKADRHATIFLAVGGMLIFISTAYAVHLPRALIHSDRIGKLIGIFSSFVILTAALFCKANMLSLDPGDSLFIVLKSCLIGGATIGIGLLFFKSKSGRVNL